MIELTKFIDDLPGYKISNSHFRLGSKIHISDFYYAKRLFQNSFFASRLAFLIAKEITRDHRLFRDNYDCKKYIDKFKNEGLTLIGYGQYSELLISLVEKFLKKYLSSERINHDLISDSDEPSFIKNYGDTFENIIIIVPIASTFSTALKIKDFISDKLTSRIILEPYINVIHVSHSPASPDEKPDENQLFPIEANFGWTKKDYKTIWIKEISGSEEKMQKYFLKLKSEWHDIKNCKLCFKEENDYHNEKPLYFTDKSSVTPTLIFGKPKAREIEENNKGFILRPETLQCGHLIRSGNHFHYYIKIEDFFQDNIHYIKEWLYNLKLKESFKNWFKETSKVIIIAPGHFSNSAFVNLVNETLFSNAANILHYDPKNDHILNFSLLYGNELNEEGTRVVFVDDTITTGSTFRKINFFVENTSLSMGLDVQKLDACIVLLDRSNQSVHKQIVFKTNYYFSFANLHLPSLKDFDGECPLDIGYKRYIELAKNSFLARMKIHFLNQKDKLEERKIESLRTKSRKTGHNDDKSYVRQVEAVHRIYEWSRNPFNNFDSTFEEWKKSLLENTKSPFIKETLQKNTTDEVGLSDETATLLKILSQSPFVHYKPIKDNLFKWVLELLQIQILKIKEKDILTYKTFKDLKFLIRRAGLLNTNFLISINLMKTLIILYESKGFSNMSNNIIDKRKNLQEEILNNNKIEQTIFTKSKETLLQEIETLQYELDNIRDFHVFFTAQIKELLFQNEARSIHLERLLNELTKDENLPDTYKQLLRFIKEENGILILNFWLFINKYLLNVANNKPLEHQEVIDVLKSISVKDHFRVKILEDFLSIQNGFIQGLHENISFINFLKLIHFFEVENKIEPTEANFRLRDKTDFIIEHLKSIICHESTMQNFIVENKNAGAFFFVKHKKNANPFLAYNKDSLGGLDESILSNDHYIKSFLDSDNENNAHKTIIEFQKKDNQWYDLYATESEKRKLNHNFQFLSEDYNRLLIIRFSKLNVDHEYLENKSFKERLVFEVQGIVGFYFYQEDEKITEITKTRYLLLLCSSISSFIQKHHENDEFRDWIEADNIRKLALLSGHGREMLLKLAAIEVDGISYKDIVLNLEHLQMIIALDNNVLEITNHSDIKERFNKFYNVNGSPEINSEYIKRIGVMAKQIFDFEEIENEVPCNIICYVKDDLWFAFHKSLLDMMCFEILLNAKKNRWHFLEEEKIPVLTNKDSFIDKCHEGGLFEFQAGVDNQGYDIDDGLKQNILAITTSAENYKLVVKISNTGPKVDDDIMKTLNNRQNPKRDSNIAGLKLLQALLGQDGFGLGEIKFNQIPLNKEVGLYKFTVELSLNAMNDG